MNDIPTLETMMELVSYINKSRKYYESEEDYELCGNLRDFSNLFSDYCLGYKTYSDIENKLYEYIIGVGDLKDLDARTGSVWLEHPMGNIFVFHDLCFQEICRLQLLLATINEEKRKNKK